MTVQNNNLFKAMNYQQAKQESFKRKWVVGVCTQGENCWCRTIKCDPPLIFTDDGEEMEYQIIQMGEVNKETVEYLIEIHNNSLKE